MNRSTGPVGVRLGIVRGISYGMFGAPDSFVPEMRRLGGTLVRVYVYWSQVEPEPGRYDWTVVDAILGQLDPADEVWVTVCSAPRGRPGTGRAFCRRRPPTTCAGTSASSAIW
ncbi:beta-galactosidase [Streptomyces decoyicus]|uniref:beta-galactosidase n=1 Tax=Streptomyces decoyicus TaxID=249567 RepID=UPI00382392B6